MLPVVCQQPHAVHSREARGGNYVGDFLKVDIVVGLDVGDALHANGEDIAQALAQMSPSTTSSLTFTSGCSAPAGACRT